MGEPWDDEPPTTKRHVEMQTLARESEQKLKVHNSTTRRLTDVAGAIVIRLAAPEDAGWFEVNPVARNVLALVDDQRTVAEIARLLSLSEMEAIRIVFELVSMRLVTLGS
jgi:hypothetical protein